MGVEDVVWSLGVKGGFEAQGSCGGRVGDTNVHGRCGSKGVLWRFRIAGVIVGMLLLREQAAVRLLGQRGHCVCDCCRLWVVNLKMCQVSFPDSNCTLEDELQWK